MGSPTHRRTSGRRLYTIVALMLAAAAAPVMGAAQAAATKTVTLKNIAFTPSRLQISAGTTVVFRWRDGSTSHDVTSVGRRRFTRLGERSSGARSVRFTKPGTYRYVCTLHPGMDGAITVR
jgi:plastocyanin